MLFSYLYESGCISEKSLKRVKKSVLPVGMLALSIGLILPRFVTGNRVVDFFSGFCIGISIVFNILGIILNRPKIKR